MHGTVFLLLFTPKLLSVSFAVIQAVPSSTVVASRKDVGSMVFLVFRPVIRLFTLATDNRTHTGLTGGGAGQRVGWDFSWKRMWAWLCIARDTRRRSVRYR